MGINDILAAIDNMKRVGVRNISDLGRDPKGALSKIAHNVKEQLSSDEGAKEFVFNSMAPGVGGIIKAKGGNWLTGSVENALSGLKRHIPDEVGARARMNMPPLSPEDLAHIQRATAKEQALNNWIEGPLTKYVKRDMATEGDPVRKLAEQGILHVSPEGLYPPNSGSVMLDLTKRARTDTGFPSEGIGKSELARMWEDASDSVIGAPYFKSEISDSMLRHDPWLANAPEGTKAFIPNTGYMTQGGRELGFPHLTDELANALNPESGLPRHLQLTPEQMQQLGMEKAVRHVADINTWRAAQQAEANLAKSQSPAVHMVREYAENNPKGLRWVELKSPDRWPEGIDPALKEEFGDLGRYSRKTLGDQLKYEGDTMGHCVGGYCEDVAGGKSRIFSLRDAKGEPHVTIETSQPKSYGTSHLNDQWDQAKKEALEQGLDPESAAFATFRNRRMEELAKENLPTNIVQIKGKQNKAPKDEYLPFVQDFVRNHPEGGKWGDVGDIQNTGLTRVQDFTHGGADPEVLKTLGDYSTMDEIVSALEKAKGAQNFAEGGLVQQTYQPLEFDGITGYILR